MLIDSRQASYKRSSSRQPASQSDSKCMNGCKFRLPDESASISLFNRLPAGTEPV